MTSRLDEPALLARLTPANRAHLAPVLAEHLARGAATDADIGSLADALVALPEVQDLDATGTRIVTALAASPLPRVVLALLGAPALPDAAQARLEEGLRTLPGWLIADTLTTQRVEHPACGHNLAGVRLLLDPSADIEQPQDRTSPRARLWPALVALPGLSDADLSALLIERFTTYRHDLSFAGSGRARDAVTWALLHRPHLRADVLRTILTDATEAPDPTLLDGTILEEDLWNLLAARAGLEQPENLDLRPARHLSTWHRLVQAMAAHPDLPRRWMAPLATVLHATATAWDAAGDAELALEVRRALGRYPTLESGTDGHVRLTLSQLHTTRGTQRPSVGLGVALRNPNISPDTAASLVSALPHRFALDVLPVLAGRTPATAAHFTYALGPVAGWQLLRAHRAERTPPSTHPRRGPAPATLASPFEVFAHVALAVSQDAPSRPRGWANTQVLTPSRWLGPDTDALWAIPDLPDSWNEWPALIDPSELLELPWAAVRAAATTHADADTCAALLRSYEPNAVTLLTELEGSGPGTISSMPAAQVLTMLSAVLDEHARPPAARGTGCAETPSANGAGTC